MGSCHQCSPQSDVALLEDLCGDCERFGWFSKGVDHGLSQANYRLRNTLCSRELRMQLVRVLSGESGDIKVKQIKVLRDATGLGLKECMEIFKIVQLDLGQGDD